MDGKDALFHSLSCSFFFLFLFVFQKLKKSIKKKTQQKRLGLDKNSPMDGSRRVSPPVPAIRCMCEFFSGLSANAFHPFKRSSESIVSTLKKDEQKSLHVPNFLIYVLYPSVLLWDWKSSTNFCRQNICVWGGCGGFSILLSYPPLIDLGFNKTGSPKYGSIMLHHIRGSPPPSQTDDCSFMLPSTCRSDRCIAFRKMVRSKKRNVMGYLSIYLSIYAVFVFSHICRIPAASLWPSFKKWGRCLGHPQEHPSPKREKNKRPKVKREKHRRPKEPAPLKRRRGKLRRGKNPKR